MIILFKLMVLFVPKSYLVYLDNQNFRHNPLWIAFLNLVLRTFPLIQLTVASHESCFPSIRYVQLHSSRIVF